MGRACSWAATCLLVLGCSRPVVCAQPDCAPDALLTRAAGELLLGGETAPSPQELLRAVREAGSDAVGLHALFVPAGARGAEQAWLQKLRERVDGELYCGRADAETGYLVIGVGRVAELTALDPSTRLVRGRLRNGYHDAELAIEAADGQLERLGVSAEALERGFELPTELALPAKVQLVARGPAGPRPVAERLLQAQGEVLPHATPAATAPTPAQAGELGQLIQQLRAARGRGALRNNRLLREAAELHARAVCAKGRVAHELAAGDGPEQRLARVGLGARVVGEAIARAESSEHALQALQNSPSHLYALLDRRFTDFGVGVSQDGEHRYCYVVLLCAWPRYLGKVAR